MNAVHIITTFLVLLACVANGKRPSTGSNKRMVVVTLPSTVTKFVTKTTTCASILTTSSNPVTPCRRRRQHWIDAPIFIGFDNREDERISHVLLRPTNVFRVEPTAVPGVEYRDDVASPVDVLSSQSPQPSFYENGDYFGSRILFGNLVNNLYNLIRPLFITITRTATTTSTVFKSTSFFISGCTPSPFPFPVCK